MENQPFIRSCLDFMNPDALFTDSTLEILQSKDQCSLLFRHNSLNGILLRVDPSVPDDEQRKEVLSMGPKRLVLTLAIRN